MKGVVAVLVAGAGLAGAGQSLLTYDKTGALLSQTEAVVRPGGVAYVSRDALYGAASALVATEGSGLHPLVWVTGEDAEIGVARIWIGMQAKAGPDEGTRKPERAFAGGQESRVGELKEVGAEGMLARLDYGGRRVAASAPLYDEHGLLAGWHLSREVDGRAFSFAAPVERLRRMPEIRLMLDQWNQRHARDREATYSRALGHLWADDIEGALFYMRKAVDADPSNGRAWMQLGFAEGKAGLGPQRIKSYRKAIEIDPGLEAARYLLGMNLLMTGDREGAKEQHKALVRLHSDYAARLKQFLDALHVDEIDDGKVKHRHGKSA
ncbi:MAG TPA: hypothetical protein PKJ41_02825 [Bryobacteraceae bacterium]|nr:hypothetical protein [Bryobacteraceae bacterium]HPT28332.1 hypothetical protein [Bryobacteraceae bacterium]